MAIQKGDEYLVPVLIRQGKTIITDQIASGVKVALGSTVCRWPNGNLTYDNEVWYFPLTQKISNSLPAGKVKLQAQVKINGKIVGTPTIQVDIQDSIIKGEWDE